MNTKDKERTRAARPARRPAAASGKRPAGKARTSAAPKKAQEAAKPMPDVVFLPPKPFNRNRLILRLLTVAAVVVALLLGVAVFFKVENFEVSGCSQYSEYDVFEASGIQYDANLLSINRAQAAGKIIRALPYVESVRIGIKLPNTVMISVTEVKVPYAFKDGADTWWLVSSGGKVIEKADAGEEAGLTKITGVRLDNPQSGMQAVALEEGSGLTDENGNPIPQITTQAQRLNMALDIAKLLERNRIIGKAASIDVTNLGDLQLWYGQQYHVKLGDSARLDYKIACLASAVDQQNSYESGVLDVSFIIRPDEVTFTPFDDDSDNFLENP